MGNLIFLEAVKACPAINQCVYYFIVNLDRFSWQTCHSHIMQGFRKSFSAWALNFKQFLAGFNFEIVGHSYKDLINKNTCAKQMHISIETTTKLEKND